MMDRLGKLMLVNGKAKMPKNFLFNLGGVSILVVAGVLAVRSSVVKEVLPLCEARYNSGVLFAYAKEPGVPLATDDIQARLGGLDWGLTTNAMVVAEKTAAKGFAIEVDVRKASDRDQDTQMRSGMGFIWQPQRLATAGSVCLSYSVWTPADFKPGDGGFLPGLLSDVATDRAAEPAPPANDGEARSDIQSPFAIRAQWTAAGTVGLYQAPNAGQRVVNVAPSQLTQLTTLKPGQWTRIEQEAILNRPGYANGVLRLFVDGKLALERRDVAFRKDEMQTFQVVTVDLHYAKGNAWAAAPVNTKLKISPLELRLK